MNCHCNPPDVGPKSYGYDAVDLPRVLGLRYIGAQASAICVVAATTGDITLSHGVLASEAVDTTIGASGVLDLTVFTTVKSLVDAINMSANWEAWFMDYPPDALTNISAGNGIFTVGGITSQPCKTTAGIDLESDTSLLTAEVFNVGITLQCSSGVRVHNKDANVRHEILQINATATYGGATDGIYIWECDDVAGTKTQIGHLPLVTATATVFPTNGSTGAPIYATVGKRLVVQVADASGAITGPSVQVIAQSFIEGPAFNIKKNWSRLSI